MPDYVKQFEKFLKDHKLDKEAKTYTHTCYGHPYGKYDISGDDYQKFVNLYTKVLGKIDLHVTEKQLDIGPWLIDIDFKSTNKHKERQYKSYHFEEIIKFCTKQITKYFSIKRRELEVFVFEKETPSFIEKSNQYKDGFHIVYPLPIHVDMRCLLYSELLEYIKTTNLFEDISYKILKDMTIF